jgi:hypothetical protein
MGKRKAYRLLVGKRPLGRARHKWVDNIKMDLGEIGWGGMNGIGLAQDRNKWIALIEPSGYIKCWKTIECIHNWWLLE